MTKEAIKKQVLDAFDHRVAVRVYNDSDISHYDIEYILDTAWLSPSSIGLEAWRFIVLDRKHIAKLRDDLKAVAWGAQPQLDTASHFVLLIAIKKLRFRLTHTEDTTCCTAYAAAHHHKEEDDHRKKESLDNVFLHGQDLRSPKVQYGVF